MSKLRIDINGTIRNMTAEEITENERLMAEMIAPMPTPEERLSILENALLELGELLGGAE